MYIGLTNLFGTTPRDISTVLRRLKVRHHMADSGLIVPGSIVAQPFEVVVSAYPIEWSGADPALGIFCLPSSLQKILVPKISVYDVKNSAARLDNHLRYILHKYEGANKEVALVIERSKSPTDSILDISPPSFLDKYQTLMCRINPYSTRVHAHRLAVGVLNGKVSKRVASEFFLGSYKLGEFYKHIVDNGGVIATAIKEAKTTPVEEVAKRLSLEPFDISYMIQSYKKFYLKDNKNESPGTNNSARSATPRRGKRQ